MLGVIHTFSFINFRRKNSHTTREISVKNRRGLTGIETAIILVAFVITSSSLAFVVLNMGTQSAEQTQTVISSSMDESSSAIQMDSDIIGTFDNNTVGQDETCLIKAVLYVRLGQGHTAIDMDDSMIMISYTNPRVHGIVYDGDISVATVTVITGDADAILEAGERFKISIDFTTLPLSGVDPTIVDRNDLYAHPYEKIRIELRPSAGAGMVIERRIPQVTNTVMGF